jgi:hypothetical protein
MQIQHMAKIGTNYFPDPILMEEIIRNHLKQADTVRFALCDDVLVCFSVASKYKMMTPFCSRPVNMLYQRMLYIDPGFLYHGTGTLLLSVTMKDLFGWRWLFKRVVGFCRTQNPVVARFMNLYNVSYPQYSQPVPLEVRKFAESLLPFVGAESLDEKFRLIGTLTAFSGTDFTNIWYRYLHHRNNNYEQLMLNSAFEKKDGRIINSGAFVLMIAYAKPLRFIRYLM